MLKIAKYTVICLLFFFTSVFSCSEKKVKTQVETECEQIKDIVTDCMGLHRGAFDYIKNCGDISLEEIENLNSCADIFSHIENKE